MGSIIFMIGNILRRRNLEPEFEREYNLKYLGLVGNVFHIRDIENAIKEYDIESETINQLCCKIYGCGPRIWVFGVWHSSNKTC